MRIAIFAAGGLGKVICDALKKDGSHDIVGFFDDKKKGKFFGYPILGKCGQYQALCKRLNIQGLIVAFGYFFLDKRLSYYKKILNSKKLHLVNAVHPKAIISDDVKIGQGIYIGPGVIVNPGTRIGDNSVVWSGAIIEHDNIIARNVFITPGVKTAGYTKIGDNSFVGLAANIAKSNIGKNVTVAAGSLVLSDIKSNSYVCGVPARTIKIKKRLAYV
ncbi:MAG: acetyltransferase [Candidatus Omnitrophica bacterium]|nr:acetyltransferase [Candidatus Omnitrophota bacterium]